MKKNIRVLQVQFDSLEDFIENSNNYWNWWTEYDRGINKRKDAPFQRFMTRYPRFSKKLIKKIEEESMDRHNELPFEQRLPWKELYASYQRISKLVFEKDVQDYNETHKQVYLLG